MVQRGLLDAWKQNSAHAMTVFWDAPLEKLRRKCIKAKSMPTMAWWDDILAGFW